MTDHAHELRRYARKIAHPAGDVPAVMLAAADEIERLHGMIAGLRADVETAHARMMTSAAAEREACREVLEECIRTQAHLACNAREALSEASARIYKRGDA